MVIVDFSIHNKVKKVCFFEKTFMLANSTIDVALKIFFFTLNNINVCFTNRKLYWKSYTVFEALLTTCHIELIDQKEFVAAALGKNDKDLVCI